MKRNDQHLKSGYLMLACMAIFSLLFFMVTNGKAAESSADYPSGPITFLNHSNPGGLGERWSRLLSNVVAEEKLLDQPLVVMNKPGSNGAVMMGYLLEKKGDPNYIMINNLPDYMSGTFINNLPYNLKSFTPIANVVLDAYVLVVRSDSPFKTIDDLIAEAKKKPMELIQGGSSYAATTNIAGLSIQKIRGVKWRFVSFKNLSQAVLNVLNGTADFAIASPSTIVDHVRAGKLKVLLTTAPNRYSQFPDVPTSEEVGLGEGIVSRKGIMGPPNMPDYAVKKLEAVFKKVMETNRFKKYVSDTVSQAAWMSTDDYRKWVVMQEDRWEKVLKEVGLLKTK